MRIIIGWPTALFKWLFATRRDQAGFTESPQLKSVLGYITADEKSADGYYAAF